MRALQLITSDLERALDQITDPVELMPAVDAVRADLAVLLTAALRRAAVSACESGRLDELAQVTWRSRRYLNRMVEHAECAPTSRPTDRVLDVISRNHLDLSDLARLRGQD